METVAAKLYKQSPWCFQNMQRMLSPACFVNIFQDSKIFLQVNSVHISGAQDKSSCHFKIGQLKTNKTFRKICFFHFLLETINIIHWTLDFTKIKLELLDTIFFY